METFIGTILLVGFNFAPRGWAFCDGQLLPISRNSALFALIGTTYGGNGQTTFALPDLRGRVAIGHGTGLGLSPRTLGVSGGLERVTLTVMDLPAHTHQLRAATTEGTTNNPEGALLSSAKVQIERGTSLDVSTYSSEASNAIMNVEAVASTGGNQSHDNMQPYLTLNYIICLEGIFPARN